MKFEGGPRNPSPSTRCHGPCPPPWRYANQSPHGCIQPTTSERTPEKEAQTKNRAAMEAVADDIDGEGQPSKKPKHSAPAPMHMGFSSGSVDGVVQRVSEPQNISRAAAFLSEGLIFHSRLSDECPSNEGLATQLTGRILWDQVTVLC